MTFSGHKWNWDASDVVRKQLKVGCAWLWQEGGGSFSCKRSESTWSRVDFHVKVEAIKTAWSPMAHRSRVRAQ
jgi:hypothetical protein